VSDQDFYSLQN
jgi:hypothetical protein